MPKNDPKVRMASAGDTGIRKARAAPASTLEVNPGRSLTDPGAPRAMARKRIADPSTQERSETRKVGFGIKLSRW
jgi:hypothetical protein